MRVVRDGATLQARAPVARSLGVSRSRHSASLLFVVVMGVGLSASLLRPTANETSPSQRDGAGELSSSPARGVTVIAPSERTASVRSATSTTDDPERPGSLGGRPPANGSLVPLQGRISASDPSVGSVDVRLRFHRDDGAGAPLVFLVRGPGPFSIDVPPGTYFTDAYVLDRGISCGFWFNHVTLGPESMDELEDLFLYRAGLFAGTVRDQDGRPIEGARVSFGDPVREGPPDVAVTDSEGRFEITTLGCRTLILGAATFHPEVYPEVEVVAGRTTRFDMVLRARATLRGTVRRADGRAVPSARVDVEQDGRGYVCGATDASGVIRFTGAELAAGPAVVRVHDDATGVNGDHRVEILPGDATVLDLVVEEGLSVQGRLLSTRGEPLPGRVVWAVQRREFAEHESIAGRATTDPDGRYELRNLAEGDYRIRVKPPEGTYLPLTYGPSVSVTASRVTGLVATAADLVIPEPGTIDVTVCPPTGEDLGAGYVVLSLVPAATGTRGAEFASRGLRAGLDVRWSQVPPGSYRLSALSEDRKLGATRLLTVSEGAQVRDLSLEMRPLQAFVRGQLVDARGAPLARVHLRVRALESRLDLHAATDETGAFAIGPVPDGTFILEHGRLRAVRQAARKGVPVQRLPEPVQFTIRDQRDHHQVVVMPTDDE
ncbi:MAG: carboxypeptidase regulatory-like domain-containing protein [Planctomycetes bacterium]|nr:carboxypeptidase regulatory-like domain-containing protein [Planctomycetota bacterium]